MSPSVLPTLNTSVLESNLPMALTQYKLLNLPVSSVTEDIHVFSFVLDNDPKVTDHPVLAAIIEDVYARGENLFLNPD